MAEMAEFGVRLRQAREARSLSRADVSQLTKIQPWVLEALEAGRLQDMMSPIYVRGFITSYAKFLKLEAQPALATLPDPSGEPEPSAQGPATPPAAMPAVSIPWALVSRLGLGAAAVAAVVALIAVRPWQHLPRIAWPAMPAPRVASVAPVSKPSLPPALPTIALDPMGPLELTVTASTATWIQVRADGKLVAQQRLQRGAKEQWSAKKRLELIIAKPSQVELLLNGRTISPFAIAHQGRLAITHRGVTRLPDATE